MNAQKLKVSPELNISNNLEIERKFLVNDRLPTLKNGTFIQQAYLFKSDLKEMRIRSINDTFQMTIKINIGKNEREEFNYIISQKEGEKLFKIGASSPPIQKTRYTIKHRESLWEIDVFQGENKGLIVAEIELRNADEDFDIPDWIEKEVTQNQAYYNSNLFFNPYKNWK